MKAGGAEPTAAMIRCQRVPTWLSPPGGTAQDPGRRTREIGLRTALGAKPRDVLAGTLSRAAVLVGSGVFAGGFLLLLFVAASGDDVALYAGFLAATTGVMLVAALLSFGCARQTSAQDRPTEALRGA